MTYLYPSVYLVCDIEIIQYLLDLYTYLYIPEKAMATHSSTLAWEIPWTEEPGGLQSMGSRRVEHN